MFTQLSTAHSVAVVPSQLDCSVFLLLFCQLKMSSSPRYQVYFPSALLQGSKGCRQKIMCVDGFFILIITFYSLWNMDLTSVMSERLLISSLGDGLYNCMYCDSFPCLQNWVQLWGYCIWWPLTWFLLMVWCDISTNFLVA